MDMAKSQWKIDQFEQKQRLKRLLNKRSALSKDLGPEAKAEIDAEIKRLQGWLQSNKPMLNQGG